jgi:hypothetical protein
MTCGGFGKNALPRCRNKPLRRCEGGDESSTSPKVSAQGLLQLDYLEEDIDRAACENQFLPAPGNGRNNRESVLKTSNSVNGVRRWDEWNVWNGFLFLLLPVT